MTIDVGEFLDTAWDAARAAGILILDNWQRPKQIDYKGAIDLVTSVDRESERIIVDILQRNFPDHGILAEEETDRRSSQSRYLWIIDPLDGTTNFAHSYPQFCVSIALQYDGEILLGVVYDPIGEECFRAVQGQGATLNQAPIRSSEISELDKSLLATGFPLRSPRERRLLSDILQSVSGAQSGHPAQRLGGSGSLLRRLWPSRRFLGAQAQTLGHRCGRFDRQGSRRQAERFCRQVIFNLGHRDNGLEWFDSR
jgi:fructose-1,6-bisphosphatase/inositol monophosphatase family enzyme